MTTDADVIVIGAGLAGLAAAATARQAGCRVLVVEAHGAGGRARTTDRDGFTLNLGAHALYRRGEGAKVLASLGIVPDGASPPLNRYRAMAAGHLHVLPTGPGSMARTGRSGPAPRPSWPGSSVWSMRFSILPIRSLPRPRTPYRRLGPGQSAPVCPGTPCGSCGAGDEGAPSTSLTRSCSAAGPKHQALIAPRLLAKWAAACAGCLGSQIKRPR